MMKFWGILGPPSYGIGATIRISREIHCLPYAGFLFKFLKGSVSSVFRSVRSSTVFSSVINYKSDNFSQFCKKLDRFWLVLMVTHGKTGSCFTKIHKVSRKIPHTGDNESLD